MSNFLSEGEEFCMCGAPVAHCLGWCDDEEEDEICEGDDCHDFPPKPYAGSE